MELKEGMSFSQEEMVTVEKSAKYLGSGVVEVYATPMMILLMENTASRCVASSLDEGMATVGTKLEVTHDAATPIGMKVSCKATLKEADGRRLVFEVEAFDEAGRIGGGVHERFVIKAEKFSEKAKAKLKK